MGRTFLRAQLCPHQERKKVLQLEGGEGEGRGEKHLPSYFHLLLKPILKVRISFSLQQRKLTQSVLTSFIHLVPPRASRLTPSTFPPASVDLLICCAKLAYVQFRSSDNVLQQRTKEVTQKVFMPFE